MSAVAAIFKGKLVKFLARAGILVPARGTVDRSSVPSAGEMAFNTTTNKLELYDGSMWIDYNAAAQIDPVDVAGIPASLDLDFSGSFPYNLIDFSRNSIATYFDQDGYLKTAAANVARIEYDPVTRNAKGFLIEEARSNLLTHSEQFDNAVWSKTNVTVSPNFDVSLDGSITSSKLIANAVTGYFSLNQAFSSVSGNKYTMTIYAKAGEWKYISLQAGGTLWQSEGTSSGIRFDLNTGTIAAAYNGQSTANGTITHVGNNIYRVSVTWTCNLTTASAGVSILTKNQNNENTEIGDGKSGIYIWGAQLEAGSFATSYIPSQQTWTNRTGTSGTATATYYDYLGILRTMSGAAARTTYNPSPDKLHLSPKLLLEPEATNLVTYSEDFGNAAWIKTNSTVSINATTAPDGTTTADKLVDNTTNGVHAITHSSTLAKNVVRTYSVFVKASEYSRVELTINAFSNNFIRCNYNLSTNTFVSSSSGNGLLVGAAIQQLKDGWFRISLTGIPNTQDASTASDQNINILDNNDSSSFAGTGTSGIFVWGAQSEELYAPTSYIPTTTATVKRYADTYTSAVLSGGRLADNASMTGSNFTGWYRWDEGTVYCEADRASTTAYSTRWHISDSSGANVIRSIGYNDNTDRLCNITLETVQQSVTTLTNATTSMKKYSAAFALNNVIGYGSGVGTLLDTTCLIPTKVTTLYVGSSSEGSFTLNGHIRRLIFWPLRISNDKLQLMTK